MYPIFMNTVVNSYLYLAIHLVLFYSCSIILELLREISIITG